MGGGCFFGIEFRGPVCSSSTNSTFPETQNCFSGTLDLVSKQLLERERWMVSFLRSITGLSANWDLVTTSTLEEIRELDQGVCRMNVGVSDPEYWVPLRPWGISLHECS